MKYRKLELEIQKYGNGPHAGELHDNLARIAVLHKSNKLLNIATLHHPRMLLSEYAKFYPDLKFLVDAYKASGWEDPNGVPSYVWEKVSLDSAIYLAENCGVVGSELHDAEPIVKDYFKYCEICHDICGKNDCQDTEEWKSALHKSKKRLSTLFWLK